MLETLPKIVLRAQTTDAIRRWAELEGKSTLMSEELIHRYVAIDASTQPPIIALTRIAELATLLVEAVRLVRSR